VNELTTKLETLKQEYNNLVTSLDLDKVTKEINRLEAETLVPNFWQGGGSKTVVNELSRLRDLSNEATAINTGINDLLGLITLSNEDDASQNQELNDEFYRLQAQYNKFKLNLCLNQEFDNHNAILTIFAGQGGTEAMDWAAMLSRMYARFFERNGWNYQILDQTAGDEAGIKSITYLVKGKYAFGLLKGEAGTHRLVRLSPFNADNLRQTSFAGVEVLPEFDPDDNKVTIKDEELEWQFYRSGGAGGQNVNKVNTAVRLKHIPTGIVVTSQGERQQEQNRRAAIAILTAKLWQISKQQTEDRAQEVKGEHKQAAWGNQIRSYVLHPYHLVKDLRTEIETSNTEAVLDGDLDRFIEGYMLYQLVNKNKIQ
jgi:peptide chain release factor 2